MDTIYSYRTSDYEYDAQEAAAQINKLYRNNIIVDDQAAKFYSKSNANDGSNKMANVDDNFRSGSKTNADDCCDGATTSAATTPKTAKILVSKTKTKTGLPLLLKSSLK